MKLLLDIGNSRLKWSLAENAELQHFGNVEYGSGGLPDTLQRLQIEETPDSVMACNVKGRRAEEEVYAWATQRWGKRPVFVRSRHESCGVCNAYTEAEKLGVDRWMAIIAAHHRGAGPACVVDAGTALTVDAVSADGKHQGGLITPGVTSMRMIIDERTQLSLPTERGSPARFGKNTDDAIASGTLQSILALVEQAYQRITDELGERPRALLTGGEAECLHDALGANWTLAPHLVLEGLAIVVASMDD